MKLHLISLLHAQPKYGCLQLPKCQPPSQNEISLHLRAMTTILITNDMICYDEVLRLQAFSYSGPPRRPPQETIDHLKMLNKSLGLDFMFCKSRNPDFLLDIIHSQVIIVSESTSFASIKRVLFALLLKLFKCWTICFNAIITSLLQALRRSLWFFIRGQLAVCHGWLIWCNRVRALWLSCHHSVSVNFC